MPDTNWKKITERCPHVSYAVYRIAFAKAIDPFQSVPIPRFLGTDEQGILSIGMSRQMERRRTNFVNGPHSEGILYRILQKYCRISEVFPDVICVYSYTPMETEEAAISLERHSIKKYLMRFGEVPPLNSAIPDRYNYDEWDELFAT